MKKNIFILLLSLILTQCQDLSKTIKNGKYDVQFTGDFSIYPSYQVEIRDSLFIEIEDDIEKWYTIDWKSKDSFHLEPIKMENDVSEDIRVPFTSKYPYYKITELSKDTVFFKYYQGDVISIVTGRFVQIKN